jgi:hypothetical protein
LCKFFLISAHYVSHRQVVSPFQAILDYEMSQGIPPGYINATIQAHAPKGAWQRLERGELSLDGSFFTEFGAELTSIAHWSAYCKKLGTRGERGEHALKLLRERYGTQADGSTPHVPDIDARKMFWNMMRMSRTPDPWVFPALLKLKASGKFVIAALSNTIDFPTGIRDENGDLFGHTLANDDGTQTTGDVRSFFDAFVSSAHTAMRKPEQRIYELALEECQKAAQKKGLGDVKMGDILFLDDIGINLKVAKQMGMRTIKVNLGRTKEAVKELEQAAGLSLIDDNGDSKL